jgi:hypothetical protein
MTLFHVHVKKPIGGYLGLLHSLMQCSFSGDTKQSWPQGLVMIFFPPPLYSKKSFFLEYCRMKKNPKKS